MLSDQIYATVLLVGLTWTKVESFLRIADIPFNGNQSSFYRFQELQYEPAITAIRNKLVQEQVVLAAGAAQVTVSIDCGWGTRRNALEGQVSCFWHKVDGGISLLDVQLIEQDRTGKKQKPEEDPADPRVTIFVGASKNYEGYGAERIGKRLKEAGVNGVLPQLPLIHVLDAN